MFEGAIKVQQREERELTLLNDKAMFLSSFGGTDLNASLLARENKPSECCAVCDSWKLKSLSLDLA